jgi:hypothetical protein
MPRTRGRYMQDLGLTDGIFFFGIEDIIGLAAADCVQTRNAAGDYSINVAATKTVTLALQLGKLLQRTGMALDTQLNFGSMANQASYDPDASPQGRYGTSFTGNPVTPRTTFLQKGIKINGFKVIYLISGAALLAHTCRVDKIVHANNVANAITTPLASAANGLATATQVNPYVTTVNLAAAEQIYRIADLSQLIFEVGAQTQGGGTYRMYGIEVLAEFNYN